MHDAYDLTQLLKITVQIESITAFDNLLFVGTKQGHLLTYSITKKVGQHKQDVQLLNYDKHFSKRPILRLEVIPDHALVSLTDNGINVHSIHRIRNHVPPSPLSLVDKSLGATYFTLDISTGTSIDKKEVALTKMCAVVKRKLFLYYFKNGEFNVFNEITVNDVPRTVLLFKNSLFIGYKSEYALHNLDKGESTALFSMSKGMDPIITKVGNGVFSLRKDNQTILINSAGVTTLKSAVKWSEPPLCVVYDKPFLIAVLSEAVEIKTIEPHLLIQTISLPKATFATNARSGLVYIANGSYVWCLQAVPVLQQIKNLLDNKHFELAFKVAQDCEYECGDEKEKNVRAVQILYAHHLFSTKQYEESMNQFVQLGTHPQEVIKLYSELLQASESKEFLNRCDRDVEDRITALICYLCELRRTHADNKSLIAVLDTTLLKCYLINNDAMINPLLRQNRIHFTETERVLKAHNKVPELVLLYEMNDKRAEALALLKQLNDVEETINHLKKLGPEQTTLLLEYAEWVIAESPQDCLRLFTNESSNAEQLPRPKILKFILRTRREIAIPYLEHAIKIWNDKSTILHTELVNLYREKYQALQTAPESRQEAAKVREKLIDLLESSDSYTPKTVIDLFPKDDMLEERAILLGKQGRHEQALSIYVTLLGNVDRAVQYCDRVWASKAPGHNEVHVLLMTILISAPESWLPNVVDPPPTKQRDLNTAISVFCNNSDKINTAQALSILPDDLPLRDIRAAVVAGLKSKVENRRQAQIHEALLYSENLQVQAQRMRMEGRHVRIDSQVCAICSKRFTSTSVVALVRTGVIHYGCLRENMQY